MAAISDLNISIKISAEEAKKIISGLADSFEKFGGTVIEAGKKMKTSMTEINQSLEVVKKGIGFLTGIIDSFIMAAGGMEKANVLLAQGLRNNAGAAGQTTESLNKLTKELHEYSGASATSIKNGERVILQQDNIGKNIFPRVARAALDVAASMGEDMASAATGLSMALENPTEAARKLRAMHVTLTEEQKKSIKTFEDLGETEKAQSVILDAVEKAHGKMAGELANTPVARMEQLFEVFKGIKEKIGDIAATVVVPLVNGIKSVLVPVKDFIEAHKSLGVVLGTIVGIVAALTFALTAAAVVQKAYQSSVVLEIALSYARAAATGIVTAAQWALTAAMQASGIPLIIAAVAGLVGVMVLLYNKVTPVRAIINALGAEVKAYFMLWVNLGGQVLKIIGDVFSFNWKKAATDIAETAEIAKKSLMDVATAGAKAMDDTCKEAEKGTEKLGDAVDEVKEKTYDFNEEARKIGDSFKAGADEAKKQVENLVNLLAQAKAAKMPKGAAEAYLDSPERKALEAQMFDLKAKMEEKKTLLEFQRQSDITGGEVTERIIGQMNKEYRDKEMALTLVDADKALKANISIVHRNEKAEAEVKKEYGDEKAKKERKEHEMTLEQKLKQEFDYLKLDHDLGLTGFEQMREFLKKRIAEHQGSSNEEKKIRLWLSQELQKIDEDEKKKKEKTLKDELEAVKKQKEDQIKMEEAFLKLQEALLAAQGGEETEVDKAIHEEEKKAEARKKIFEKSLADGMMNQEQYDAAVLANLDTLESEKALIKKKYEKRQQASDDEIAKKKIEQDRQVQDAIFKTTEQVFGAAAELAVGSFGMHKGLAMSQAAMSTAEAAINAYKSTAEVPIVGPTLAPFAAAAAIAFGVAQEIKIAKEQEPKKMASGGMMYGEQPYVVGDAGPEFVANAQATARNRPVLEAMNRGATMADLTGGPMKGVTSSGGSQVHIVQLEGAFEIPHDSLHMAVKKSIVLNQAKIN